MRSLIGGPALPRTPHLPGSRSSAGDVWARGSWAEIATGAAPLPTGARVWVEEKLDGSCVAILRRGRALTALNRLGHPAALSMNDALRRWAEWVDAHTQRLLPCLEDGEWVVGEWLMQAHSTRYALPHAPFVPFDLYTPQHIHSGPATRQPRAVLAARIEGRGLPLPGIVAEGPLPAREALARLGHGAHGALNGAEGVIYRMEREREHEHALVSVGKVVRVEKVPGCLLPENTGRAPIWNTWPASEPPLEPPAWGSFEAHLTVAPGADRAAFAAACAGLGVKCVDIELARGDHPAQPLTASIHRGTLEGVLSELRAQAAVLEAAGFEVVRTKVEALGDHPLTPTDDDSAATRDGYFEFHLKVRAHPGQPLDALREIAVAHGAHLSRNARKHLDDGDEERFVTQRIYRRGRASAEAALRALAEALLAAGWDIRGRTREYTVYDSNAAIDDRWLPA